MRVGHITAILIIAVLGVATLGVSQGRADDQEKKALYDQKVLELKELTAKMQVPGITPDQYKELKAKYDQLSSEIDVLAKELAQDKVLQERQAAAKRAYNEGNTFAKTSRFEEALKAYDHAIAQDSSFAKAFYGRGLALANLRRYDEALAAYQRAIALDPMYHEAYTALGNLYQKMGKYQDAVDVYTKAINYNAQNAKAYYNLGTVYQNYLKDPAKAVEAFRRATQIDPNYYQAFSSLGVALADQAKLQEAILAHETALAINEKHFYSHYRLAELYNNVGRYQDALEAAEQCLKYKEGYAPAQFEAGRAAEALGDKAKALFYYELAAKDRRWAPAAQYHIEELKKK